MRRFMILFLLTGFAMAHPVFPVSTLSQSDAELDALVAKLMASAKIPGLALARIEEGRVAWTKVYGEASPGKPVTVQTSFNVASLTKPVFGVMVMHLVAQSQFNLDESLANYWVDPDLEGDPRVKQLTARMVLSHQTGLPNWRGNKALAFQFNPGEGTDYSGEGYEFLRRAIEKATGKTLPELMKGLVKKAQMETASFGWPTNLEGNIATGFDEKAQPISDMYLKERGPAAASSLFCSIEDYANFTAWVSRGADLPQNLFQAMQQNQAMHQRSVEEFGLGWRLVDANGIKVLTHDGREDGVRTLVYVVPKDRSGFVLICNSSNGELLTRPLTQAVMPNGTEIVDAMDENAYRFALSVPAKIQPKMLAFIAQSPAFVSKLLHGAEVHLIRPHFASKKDTLQIQKELERLVMAQQEGQIASEKLLAFFKTMGRTHDEGFELAASLTQEEAEQWRKSVFELLKN